MKTVLFDLDGTLLPLDQDEFIRGYFGALAEYFEERGRDSRAILKAVNGGIGAMLANDGTQTNEQAFWSAFIPLCGDLRNEFDVFYDTVFDSLDKLTEPDPAAARIVDALKAKGARLVLASNPVFPMSAQKKRMLWARVDQNDFEYITSYENSYYCKPNTEYYKEIADRIGAACCDCIMIGNDVGEDMPAKDAGMHTFLLTNRLINRNGVNIAEYDNGGFDGLADFITGYLNS